MGLFLIIAAWSLASPPTAIPDEPAHLAYGQGVWRGDFSRTVVIPKTPQNRLCFAFKPEQSVACAEFEWIDELSAHTTNAAYYPPAFYLLTGWTQYLGAGIARGYLLRIAAAALNALALTLALKNLLKSISNASAHRNFKREMQSVVAFTLIILTPTAAMYAGSYNPSGFVFSLATGILLIGSKIRLSNILGSYDLVLLSIYSSLFLLSRRDSAIWLFGIALVILISCSSIFLNKIKTNKRQLVFASIPPSLSLIYLLNTSSGEVASRTLSQSEIHEKVVAHTWWVSTQIPKYFDHITTTFGWLDTRLPGLLSYLASMFYGGMILFGISYSKISRRSTVFAVGYFIVIPILLIAVMKFGYYQGRYALPLLPLLFGGPLLSLRAETKFGSLAERFPIVVALITGGVLQITSIWQFIRRNSLGLASDWNVLTAELLWRPVGGAWLPILMIGIGYLVAVLSVKNQNYRAVTEMKS